jgi:tagatose 1,6-diphosphate aldolase
MTFTQFRRLADGPIAVLVEKQTPGDPARDFVPMYECAIVLADRDTKVGGIDVRIGDSPWMVTFAGQLGYGIDEDYRGHRYAAHACRAIVPIARHHGFSTLWITTNPDNAASRRTCEIIGATLVEIVELPPGNDMYQRGERHKCRYRWELP